MRINFNLLKAKGFAVSEMADGSFEIFATQPIPAELLELATAGVSNAGLKDMIIGALAEAREQALFLEAIRS